MIKKMMMLLLFLCIPRLPQSINGIPNQLMAGFTAVVTVADITGYYVYDVHVRLLRLS